MPSRRPTTISIRDTRTWCVAFSRHDFDGHVYVEIHRVTGRKVWVARLMCRSCGTERVDFMTPQRCELLSRRYFHPDDYATDLDRETARQQVMRSLLEEPPR